MWLAVTSTVIALVAVILGLAAALALSVAQLFEEQWASEIDKALPKASKVTKEQVDAGSAAEVKTAATKNPPTTS